MADRHFDPASDLRAAAGNILSDATLDKSGDSSAEMECRKGHFRQASSPLFQIGLESILRLPIVKF